MPDPVKLHDRYANQDDQEVEDENEEDDPQDVEVDVEQE